MADAPIPSTPGNAFVPKWFVPPVSLSNDGFQFEPLGPQHNERDHIAWMSSVEFIQSLPGFEHSDWPSPMSLDDNRADLEGHANDFNDRSGFTYSILDGDDVIGCVYIYPSTRPGHDASVKSWVTQQRAAMDGPLRAVIRDWISDVWPFRNPYIP